MRKEPSRFDWLDRVAAMTASEKEKAMLWPLAYHARIAGECHPAIATLARESGCGDPRTARRRLHDLKAKGLIQITPRSVPFHADGRTLYLNCYRLTLPIKAPERPDTALSGHSGMMTGQNGHNDRTKHDNDRTKHDNDRTQLCPPNPIGSQKEANTGSRVKKPAGLPDHRIDYEKIKLPEINDYSDIAGCPDPIQAAMAITGERGKQGFGYWVKVLNQGRKEYGTERAERLFRGCLEKLFGEIKNGEVNNPGAILNEKLKVVFR